MASITVFTVNVCWNGSMEKGKLSAFKVCKVNTASTCFFLPPRFVITVCRNVDRGAVPDPRPGPAGSRPPSLSITLPTHHQINISAARQESFTSETRRLLYLTCTVPVPPLHLVNSGRWRPCFSGSVCNVSVPMTLVGEEKNGNAGEETQRTSRPIAAAGAHVDATCTSTSGEVHRVGERSRALMRWVGDSFTISTATFADQPVLLQRGS